MKNTNATRNKLINDLQGFGLPLATATAELPARALRMAPAANGKTGALDQQRELILQIYQEYPTISRKGVEWSKAFAEHPEWCAPLGVSEANHRSPEMIKLYSRAASVVKKAKKEPKAERVAKVKAARVSRPRSEFQPPIAAIGVKHCPECGCPLAMHNIVAAQMAAETQRHDPR